MHALRLQPLAWNLFDRLSDLATFLYARLADLATRHRTAGLREMVEAIDAAVLAFRSGPPFADDVSLLVVERT